MSDGVGVFEAYVKNRDDAEGLELLMRTGVNLNNILRQFLSTIPFLSAKPNPSNSSCIFLLEFIVLILLTFGAVVCKNEMNIH